MERISKSISEATKTGEFEIPDSQIDAAYFQIPSDVPDSFIQSQGGAVRECNC